VYRSRIRDVETSDMNSIDAARSAHGRVAGDELSAATITRRLSIVSRYYKWLDENSDTPIKNPVARVRRPKVRNQAARAVDERILAELIQGISDACDRAIVLLFVYSGLRLSELQQLNKDSITLSRHELPDRSREYYGSGEVLGKGSKRHQFIVGPKAVVAVRDYLAAERMSDNIPALFISSRQRRLSCRAIQQIIDKWCKRLGLKHVHVHQLRHSFATRSANAGMSSPVLRELMGHANLTTTQRYFQIGQERLAREYHAALEYIRQTSDV
jgi:integrase/recombinase XerC